MSGRCLAETCAHWTGHGCLCEVLDIEPTCLPCQLGDTGPDHDTEEPTDG